MSYFYIFWNITGHNYVYIHDRQSAHSLQESWCNALSPDMSQPYVCIVLTLCQAHSCKYPLGNHGNQNLLTKMVAMATDIVPQDGPRLIYHICQVSGSYYKNLLNYALMPQICKFMQMFVLFYLTRLSVDNWYKFHSILSHS